MTNHRAETKVRMGAGLLRAARAKAVDEGLSLNSYIVHVLAAAVGTELFRAPAGEEGATAEPRVTTVALEGVDLMYARAAFRDAHWESLGPVEIYLTTDEQVLEWDRAGRPRPGAAPEATPEA